ncbi:sigma-70 family RNA polymerase sigma factor [Orrella sp. JC864]|uniref:RNA polymerase sigma factor n=1 Tax=Orrella sp. JC864 TaxID=3120298 RepID=UPI00300B06C7
MSAVRPTEGVPAGAPQGEGGPTREVRAPEAAPAAGRPAEGQRASEPARPDLLDFLAKRYEDIKLRLTRLLGSDELAGDALQDTWLRLHAREEAGLIKSPTAYLVRIAVNIAVDIQRRQGKSLPLDEVNALMEMADPVPGPARSAETRSELQAAMRVMERMPARRREILLMVRWEGLPQKEVARRLGVTVRTVEHELKRAHTYLDEQMRHARN